MTLHWSHTARRHLDEVWRFIAADNPAAARGVVRRLRLCAERIAAFPPSGEALPRDGLHAATVPGTPYRLVDAPRPDSIFIIAVWHGAREWPFGTE